MLISEALVRYSSKNADNETGGFNIGLCPQTSEHLYSLLSVCSDAELSATPVLCVMFCLQPPFRGEGKKEGECTLS